MQITPALRAAILAHGRRLAVMTPPEEAAGVIIDGGYRPCINKSPVPQRAFVLDPAEVLAGGVKGAVAAIVHSHPGGPACPSHEDMQQQQQSGLPWVIASLPTATTDCREDVFVFGLPPRIEPGAGYRHGVNDCYSLIRGYYAEEMGIVLPDIPRGWGWWHDGRDHYAAHYAETGFSPLGSDENLLPGDVFLARIRAPVINHAGIWLGDGLILHHLAGQLPHDPSRLPRKEPCARWYPFIQTWLRYRRR